MLHCVVVRVACTVIGWPLCGVWLQIYVEIERARLTRTLAQLHEAEGRVADAADVLQELQVETFGSMEKREKVDFILEQMRLCLARHDYIRTQIISKKISRKFFADESTHVRAGPGGRGSGSSTGTCTCTFVGTWFTWVLDGWKCKVLVLVLDLEYLTYLSSWPIVLDPSTGRGMFRFAGCDYVVVVLRNV